MADRKPLTDKEGEVRELTTEDFAQMIPFSALPAEIQHLLSSPNRVATDSGETKQPAA